MGYSLTIPGKFTSGQHCFSNHIVLHELHLEIKFAQKDLPEKLDEI